MIFMMDVVKINWWVWFFIDPFWLPQRGHIPLSHPPPRRGLHKEMEVYGDGCSSRFDFKCTGLKNKRKIPDLYYCEECA